MYKIAKHRELPCIPCLGETHVRLQAAMLQHFSLTYFPFLAFATQLFSTQFTSSNLRNQAPPFTLGRKRKMVD